MHEPHVASLSTVQPDLRQQIINHIVEDEMYVQVKDNLQQQNLEKKYGWYKLEEDDIFTYKSIIYIPNVAYLKGIVMDEIHQAPYSCPPGFQKTIAKARK